MLADSDPGFRFGLCWLAGADFACGPAAVEPPGCKGPVGCHLVCRAFAPLCKIASKKADIFGVNGFYLGVSEKSKI